MKNINFRNHQLKEMPKTINWRNQEFRLIFLVGLVGESVICVLYHEGESSFLKVDTSIERVSENTEIHIKFVVYAFV